MYLTREEEKILEGEEGEERRKAMEILVGIGEVYNAEKLIPVTSVQVAGVSYKSIGEAGLKWLESFKEARVTVPTTLNPAGMDLERWRSMQIPEKFAVKQLKIIEVFKKLGVTLSCTCTPYLSGNLPKFRDHLAWSESSAVCFANSVIGARTNREGGPSALAAAIIGKTPYYGYHLDENRKATLKIKVSAELKRESDFGALGYWAGKLVKTGVPLFTDINECKTDELKALGAALAASGGVALFHIENITPESHYALGDKIEKVEFEEKDLRKSYEELTTKRADSVDLAAIGCPHASLNEIKRIAELLKGKKVDRKRS